MSSIRRTGGDRMTDMTHPTCLVPERDEVGSVRQSWELDRRWAVDASGVLALLAGVIFAVIGTTALVALGTEDFPSEARAEVIGMGLTQIWAVGSVVLGLIFLVGVGGRGRTVLTFAGAVAVVAGIVGVVAHDRLDPTLAVSASYGWTALIAGAVVLTGAFAVPTAEAHRRERFADQRGRRLRG